MNDELIDRFLSIMTGAWPTPALDENQVEVWSEVLSRLDLDPAMEALQKILRSNNRSWSGRPNPEEFLSAYSGITRRRRELTQGTQARRELSTPMADEETRKKYLRGCWESLARAGAKGAAKHLEDA